MAETLITSSVIILMLCAIRILFKGRIRPTVQYSLWGIAAARLALPCFYPVIRWFGSLQVYHDLTEPLIAYYEKKGVLKTVIGQERVEDTSELVRRALGV